MEDSTTYARGPTNTVNRLKARANYDAETIHGIVNSCPIVHVSFNPDSTTPNPMPIILPMIGQMAQYSKDSEAHCYLHGYVSSRLMKLGASASENDSGEDAGLPVCVAATHMDGLVLALTPFSHSYDYRSAVLTGLASIVEDPDEKLWAMELITESVLRGRWTQSRTPPDKGEMQSTRIMKVKIVAASAKVREGGPGDDRKDLKREDVVGSVWTGVVPFYGLYGAPVPSGYNKVAKVPGYIHEFVKEENQQAEKNAIDVAGKPYPPKKKKDDET